MSEAAIAPNYANIVFQEVRTWLKSIKVAAADVAAASGNFQMLTNICRKIENPRREQSAMGIRETVIRMTLQATLDNALDINKNIRQFFGTFCLDYLTEALYRMINSNGENFALYLKAHLGKIMLDVADNYYSHVSIDTEKRSYEGNGCLDCYDEGECDACQETRLAFARRILGLRFSPEDANAAAAILAPAIIAHLDNLARVAIDAIQTKITVKLL